MLDPEGRIETFNAPAARIKGYALDEVRGRHFSMFFTPEDRAAGLPERELEVARAGGRYEGEGWRLRKDGTRFYAAVSLSALHGSLGRARRVREGHAGSHAIPGALGDAGRERDRAAPDHRRDPRPRRVYRARPHVSHHQQRLRTVVPDAGGADPGQDYAGDPRRRGLRSASPPPSDRPPPAIAHAAGRVHCPPQLDGLRILVVDDEPDAAELVRVVLEQCSAVVRVATTAAAALAAFRAEVPDILLSDIAMPHESGYALIRKIRALPPESGGRVPAVALTAYASMTDRTRALLEGYTNHCAKPMEPEELVAVVAALVGRHAQT